MDTRKFTLARALFRFFTIISLPLLSVGSFAQDPDCQFTVENGLGYATTVESIVPLGDQNYAITLSIYFNGCPGPGCKNVSYVGLEAAPGTYSNVSAVAYVDGDTVNASINLGPTQGGLPFTGIKISGLGDFGQVNDAELVIHYTLSGGFQTQQTLVKAGSNLLFATLNASDFQTAFDCFNSNIFPYYPPPFGGKAGNDCVILGPELCSFYQTYINLGAVVTDDIFQTDGVTVLIVVEAVDGKLNELVTALSSSLYGMTETVVSVGENAVTGLMPILNLPLINDLTGTAQEARPVYPPETSSGIVTSQGDVAMRADLARLAFSVSGNGVKVGVLSDSYNTKPGNPANDDVLKGDLPGIGTDALGNSVPNPLNDMPVHVLADYPATLSDEGRAMLQIIHDVAPGADLAFRTGFRSDVDFAQGILDLAAAGCDIIVDDITYIEEPFFRDGLVAHAVETVSTAGVSYFSAAGNFGSRGYLSAFNGVDAPAGLSGEAHNFADDGSTDVYQSVTVPEGSYTIVLQYDDGQAYGNAIADIDIYLARDDGSPLFGFNRVNTGGRQLEVLPFTVGAGGATTNIIIVNATPAYDVTIQYVVFRGLLEQNEWSNPVAPTLVGQANAESAIAVGAVLYANTPPFGVDPPTPASFSSRGGTPVNGIVRSKPNVMGPNGVNTTVNLGGVNYEGDEFPNFFGTSAAAPHVAAIGALLTEAQEVYWPGTTMNPSLMKTLLESTARDMGDPGHDAVTGHGFAEADAALAELANPRPLVYDLIYDENLTPGLDDLDITINGEYLSAQSIIYLNGETVSTTITVSEDGTTLTATLDPFGPLVNQTIQVGNPSITDSGLDGGLSDPLYFTDKPSIVITIADETKVYGESLPAFTAESIELVQLDGSSVPLETSGLAPEAIARIQSIVFEAPNVSELTNSGLWAIKAVTTDPLNPASTVAATDPLDIALLGQYNFAIFNGLLTIENLEMTIVPQEQTITFGEEVGQFGFDYIFNDDPLNPLNIDAETASAITSAVTTAHATVLVNARATALVNAQATALVNYSFLVSATVLVNSGNEMLDLQLSNAAATALVNGNATPLVNGTATATVLVNGVSTATVLVNATALVNGTATVLVNGTATPLVNATALVNANATALVNSSTINANSNSQAIIILGQQDIEVLLGNQSGEIVLKSMNLFPSTDAGSHWVIPGTLIYPNLNITYDVGGPLNVIPATAAVSFDPASLQHTYDGTGKSAVATTVPGALALDYLYDGSIELPVSAGTYIVTATINEQNYVGTATTSMVIDPAALELTADALSKTYGEADPGLTFQITGGVLYGDDAIDGTPVREAGEDAGTYLISQGSLTAGPDYDLSFVGADFTINPALLTVSAVSASKIYGSPDPVFDYIISSGELVGDDSFSGSLQRDTGEDVGDYEINQGGFSAGDNYLLTFIPGTLSIEPAPITVTADSYSKTYGEADPDLIYQFTGMLYFNDQFTGSLTRETGEDVGSYAIEQGSLSLSNNYALTFISGELTITPAAITVAAVNASKVYGQTDPALTYQVTQGALFNGDAFSGTLLREMGENVGAYVISQGTLALGANYDLSFVPGVFTISKADLTISIDPAFQYIYKGDPLPFIGYAFDGFVNGDDQGVLSGLSYSFSPTYSGLAGTYQIIPQASSVNYMISTVNGTLHVNPFGPGTKHIIPKVICVTNLGNGNYLATFQYTNNNSATVYVPLGENNFYWSATGLYSVDNPPAGAIEFFLPGDHTFDIPFDGASLTWTVASYNHKGQLAAQGSSASASSPSCSKDSEVEPDDIPVSSEAINAYPNPTSGNVLIDLAGNAVPPGDIAVFDIRGNKVQVGEIRPSGNNLSVDLSGQEAGVYLIRINMASGSEMIRIIKQ